MDGGGSGWLLFVDLQPLTNISRKMRLKRETVNRFIVLFLLIFFCTRECWFYFDSACFTFKGYFLFKKSYNFIAGRIPKISVIIISIELMRFTQPKYRIEIPVIRKAHSNHMLPAKKNRFLSKTIPAKKPTVKWITQISGILSPKGFDKSLVVWIVEGIKP